MVTTLRLGIFLLVLLGAGGSLIAQQQYMPGAAPYSAAPMVLLSSVAATATQTGSATTIPFQSTSGTLVVTGSGITGSPSGCTVALDLQQSTGAPTSAAIAIQPFTPASSYQSFVISPANNFQGGDKMIAVYACGLIRPQGRSPSRLIQQQRRNSPLLFKTIPSPLLARRQPST